MIDFLKQNKHVIVLFLFVSTELKINEKFGHGNALCIKLAKNNYSGTILEITFLTIFFFFFGACLPV